MLFPTNNSSLDAYAYAGYVEYNSYLFKPHHLLSHAFLYLIVAPFKALNISIDILWLGKFVNGIFQLFNLWVFYKILAQLKIGKQQSLLLLLVIGLSFNLWQYGTEHEVYIVPILFSLSGSYYFLKYLKNSSDKYVLFSGSFAAFACLFHQLHFFWWLGLLMGIILYSKKIQTFLWYAIPALMVPIAYAIVLVTYQGETLTFKNLYGFMLFDFLQEDVVNASYTWKGWKSLLFQAVNTFRIFLQAHPNILVLLKTSWVYFIPLIVSIALGGRLLWQFFKERNVFAKRTHSLGLFANVHMFVIVTVYIFALYSYGNVEFLVALPFALLIYLCVRYEINQRFLQQFIALLFIWNFSFGILPDCIYSYYNDEVLVDYIIEHPEKTFLVKSPEIGNQYFYKTGINYPPNVIYFDKVSNDTLQSILKNDDIYTDAINKPTVFNRAKIDAIGNQALTLDTYRKDSVFSYEGLYGNTEVYRILKYSVSKN